MNTDSMHENIMEQVASVLEIDPAAIGLEQTLQELEIDSILFIRIVVQCETALEIQFEDEMLLMSKFDTIGMFVDYVQSRCEQAQQSK